VRLITSYGCSPGREMVKAKTHKESIADDQALGTGPAVSPLFKNTKRGSNYVS